MSTREGADRVAAARREGWPVWAEVTPHHLTHTGAMEDEVGCWGKVTPPLGGAADVDRLWRAFHDGGITCLGSDHGTGGRTHATKAKGGPKHGNIWKARSGNRGGLEHFLPVLVTFGVHAGRISIEDVARGGALNTAKVFGLYPRKGAPVPGADAEAVSVEPDRAGHGTRGHCATATERIRFGSRVITPVTRHPAVAASAAATLEELAPGRTMIGIGSGDSAAYNIGAKAASLGELREYALAIRSLMTTGRAEYHGRMASFTWSRARVPIYLAASGPKTLRLAGQIADGAVIRTGLTPTIVRDSIAQVQAGAREAGRDPAELDLSWWPDVNR